MTLVTIAVAGDITEADGIRSVLNDAGIETSVEAAEGAEPGPIGDGPCRVLVDAGVIDEAKAALEAADDGDEPGW